MIVGSEEYWAKFHSKVVKKKPLPPPPKKKVDKDPELLKQEHREAMKRHYEKFKDEYKEYYQNNKENILKRQNEKHACECGGKYTTNNKVVHLATKKHKRWLGTFTT